jgi:CHASE1-domain containing sensor protein
VGNKPVLGLDVASILSHREALQQARDTGLPAVTGRLTLGQEPGRQFGLLVFLRFTVRGFCTRRWMSAARTCVAI